MVKPINCLGVRQKQIMWVKHPHEQNGVDCLSNFRFSWRLLTTQQRILKRLVTTSWPCTSDALAKISIFPKYKKIWSLSNNKPSFTTGLPGNCHVKITLSPSLCNVFVMWHVFALLLSHDCYMFSRVAKYHVITMSYTCSFHVLAICLSGHQYITWFPWSAIDFHMKHKYHIEFWEITM